MENMTIGEIVDYIIEYNERNKTEEKDKPKKRKATQGDIDAFFGG